MAFDWSSLASAGGAILGGVVGGPAGATIGGALGSALAGSSASNKAASKEYQASQAADIAQRDAAKASLALQRPTIDTGYNALSYLSNLYGLGTPAPINWNQVDQSLGYKGSDLRDTGQQYGKGYNLFVDPTGAGYIIARSGANTGQAVPIGKTYPEYAQAPQAATPGQGQTATPASGGTTSAIDQLLNSAPIQFVRNQGEQAINRMAAAKGQYISGARLKGITDYNSNLASTNFQNLVIDPMFKLAGYGRDANTAGGNTIVNAGTNSGNAIMNGAAARSSGYAANNLYNQNMIGAIGGGIADYFRQRSNSAYTPQYNYGGGWGGPQYGSIDENWHP